MNFDEDTLEEIKMNRNRVRNSGEKFTSGGSSTQAYEISYDLPDGNQIKLNQSELTLPYEKLFQNYIRGEEELLFSLFSKSGHNQPNLVSMVIDSLEKVPIQHKKDLIGNLILAGGNTKAPNFAERLAQEVITINLFL